MSLRDWMEFALYDRQEGYYRRADLTRWGRAGDYRTSPERTPLFAATFARYFADLHAQLGSPPRWTILEAGSGAGHFARVVLDTLDADHPQVLAATRYLLDETSPASRAQSAERLVRFSDRIEFVTTRELPAGAIQGVIFSNELLDALPVHRVRVSGGRLREMCVGLDDAGEFVWIERDPSTPRLAEHFARSGVALAEGQCAEVNLAAEDWLAHAARALTRGFVVTADYGAESAELYDPNVRPDGTLRAFRAHQLCPDPLSHPGEQDLTATVDWTQIRRAGERAGLRTVLFDRQDRFLLRAGLLEQLERLAARAASEAERASLRLSARDFVLPGGMSESFQVLVQEKP